DAAGVKLEVRPGHHLVSPRGKLLLNRDRNPSLDAQSASFMYMRIERVGKREGGDPRRLHGLLWCHAEMQNIKKSLQHALRNDVPAGRAKSHHPRISTVVICKC